MMLSLRLHVPEKRADAQAARAVRAAMEVFHTRHADAKPVHPLNGWRAF
jgi:hypothetical protein